MANVGTAAAGKTLIGAGNGKSPTYADIGTNSGLTAHGVVIAEGNSAFTISSPSTSGFVLTSNGASSDPTFQSVTATGAATTITGNSGGALNPTAGNWNILTDNTTVKFVGSGSTLTQDFGLTNLIMGSSAVSISTGNQNTAVGFLSGGALTSGQFNSFFGTSSGRFNTIGTGNAFFGVHSGQACVSGGSNTSIGQDSLSNITGTGNIGIGYFAGSNYGNVTGNIAIGNIGTLGESNVIRIGTQGSGSGQQNTCYIAGIASVAVANTQMVTIDTTTGQLGSQAITGGTVTSVSGTTNRITSTGGTTPVIDISASYVGQSSITTLGTVTTGTWNGSVIDLAHGGTNANLTASNGGIFYSTATAGAILAGTATANKVLMSGASTTPSWSTPTFPNSSATTGKIIISDGTNWTASTPTFPATAGTSGNLLTSDGTNWNSTAPAVSSLITTITSTGSWTINPRTVSVEFYVWSGGGGGGSGRCGASAAAGGGAGGGAGNFLYTTSKASDLTSSPYTVTIGDGGTGGISINATTTDGNPGGTGGTTSIGSAIVVIGGGGGGGGINGTSTAGSGTGLVLVSAAPTNPGGNGNATTGLAANQNVLSWASGGGGAPGYTSATARAGRAGGNIADFAGSVLASGGAAGTSAGGNGGAGNTVTGAYIIKGGTGGGSGGHNGVVTAGSGGAGAQPGGGGGGGAGNLSLNASGVGGAGGKGQVIIVEHF